MIAPPDGAAIEHQPHCMVCGSENPAGLGLRMRIAGDRVHGELRLDRRHEGAPGFAHGGAIAAALDDLLGSVLTIISRPAVTASLTVDFRAPALLGRDLTLIGWAERVDGRKLHLRGTVHDRDQLVAEARALFLEVDLAHFQRGGQPLPEAWSAWGDGNRAPAGEAADGRS